METIELRAALVIGTGSLSFNLVKSLTDRIPMMPCTRWFATPTQPIAVDDVLAWSLDVVPIRPMRIREAVAEALAASGN